MALMSLAVCGNCLVVGFNDDWSGVDPDDPTPLGLLDPGDHLVGTVDDDPDAHFSHSPCDGCGGLPGDRVSVWVATN